MKIPDVADYLANIPQIISAYLFGSYAKGEQDQISDVDIALLFQPDLSDEEMAKLELSIWQKLAAILCTDEIDVLVLNQAPLVMQFEIIRTGKRICNNDNDRRIDFEVRACNRYWDFKRLKDEYDHYSLKSLRQKYEDNVHEFK